MFGFKHIIITFRCLSHPLLVVRTFEEKYIIPNISLKIPHELVTKRHALKRSAYSLVSESTESRAPLLEVELGSSKENPEDVNLLHRCLFILSVLAKKTKFTQIS